MKEKLFDERVVGIQHKPLHELLNVNPDTISIENVQGDNTLYLKSNIHSIFDFYSDEIINSNNTWKDKYTFLCFCKKKGIKSMITDQEILNKVLDFAKEEGNFNDKKTQIVDTFRIITIKKFFKAYQATNKPDLMVKYEDIISNLAKTYPEIKVPAYQDYTFADRLTKQSGLPSVETIKHDDNMVHGGLTDASDDEKYDLGRQKEAQQKKVEQFFDSNNRKEIESKPESIFYSAKSHISEENSNTGGKLPNTYSGNNHLRSISNFQEVLNSQASTYQIKSNLFTITEEAKNNNDEVHLVAEGSYSENYADQ